jgi:hypothetical protein
MAIKLLAIASNYEGTINQLPDCILDSENIIKTFSPFCDTAESIVGKDATRDGIRSAVATFIGGLQSGDLGILYFSGHGTTDRVQGKKVEAIVCDDFELIYDFEMRVDLNKRADGSMLAAIADSCYSGGLSRGLVKGKPRTMPAALCVRHRVRFPVRTPKRPNSILEGCDVKEVSYSTGHGGAMTNVLIPAFNERKDNTTLPAIYKRIRKSLPSKQWPQTPQLVIDKVLEKRTLKSFTKA